MQIALWVFILLTGVSLQGETQTAELTGREMCVVCHEMPKAFLNTPHSVAECEACHGAGSLHVEAGGDQSLSLIGRPASYLNEMCLPCHGKGQTQVADFGHSPHGKNQVSCADCHRVHPEHSSFGLLKMETVPLCVSCHRSTEAGFRQPYHHPVLEGGMSCLDCHSPHSDPERSARLLETIPSNGCVSCHSDKKGPFAFEHAAVGAGLCQDCHKPHGSFNPLLLVRSEVHQLCLECHSMTPGVAGSQPPAFHDLRSPRYRNCTVCHRAIHGSNTSPAFLR